MNLSLCLGWFVRPITPGDYLLLSSAVGWRWDLTDYWVICVTDTVYQCGVSSPIARNRGTTGRRLPLMKAIFMAKKVQENLCLLVYLQNNVAKGKEHSVIQFCEEESWVWRV